MEIIPLNISVKALSEAQGDLTLIINSTDGKRLLDKTYSNLTFELDYPLTEKLLVNIPDAKTVADILIPIATAYKEIIYSDSNNKYGVWGHGFEDLYFSEITIKEDGLSQLIISS